MHIIKKLNLYFKSKMTSTTLDDFKIERVLGKGSFSSVNLVTRKKDNRIYALKSVILEKLSKKQQENSVNEVRILASINHPNVIGYKEAFWDEKSSTLNIVMEYADGGDLQSKINIMKNENGFFNESLIWHYSIQMIQGLKALHDKKIMHRDLKSANIFLVKENLQCKIGDMNVSKVMKDNLLRTQTGTPYYASPEVWMSKPYSYKSDLWSIGCIIYELCELRPPFTGSDMDELFINVCKGKIERINKVYSDDLWNMINMLLKVDVEKRVDCNQFLESQLIKNKIKEMKNNDNFINNEFLDKNYNEEHNDEKLLETIKFMDIYEIKSQLPKKKNYDGDKEESILKNDNDSKKKEVEYKETNKNKIIIKEIKKELDKMKYKEELRKKERKENLEKKFKIEKNDKEKNLIKEKIKQCEKKLIEEKDKKFLELNLKNSKCPMNKRIIIPMNFNKKIKFRRPQLTDKIQNTSLLSLLTNSTLSKNNINNIKSYYNINQTSIKYEQDTFIKNNHVFDIKLNSHSPLITKKKYQSFTKFEKYKKVSNCIPTNKEKHSTLLINTKNINFDEKSPSLTINERQKNKANVMSYLTINSSIGNSDRNFKKKYSFKNFNGGILNLKSINNNKFNLKHNLKNQNIEQFCSTPNLKKLKPIFKLLNLKKDKVRKKNININFNDIIPNNFQRYLNTRYSKGNKKSIINRNNISTDISIISKKSEDKINSSNFQKYFSLKSKFNYDSINFKKNTLNSNFNRKPKICYKVKINSPINTYGNRKLTEINLEAKLNKIKNQIIHNKNEGLKYELTAHDKIAYNIINNAENINENILKNRNNYTKRNENNDIKNSFIHIFKKDTINKILINNKSKKINKYYNYHMQKYSFPKNKESFNSINYFSGKSCVDVPYKTRKFIKKIYK